MYFVVSEAWPMRLVLIPGQFRHRLRFCFIPFLFQVLYTFIQYLGWVYPATAFLP